MKMNILFKICIYIFLLYGNIMIGYANSKILNIYIWGNYLPEIVCQKFTAETGITINITEYDNNETMFSKLSSIKKSGYDIVVPSNYYIERMIKLGMLHPLNKNKLIGLKNIHPILLSQSFYLNDIYSIPYLWGNTGIIINTKYIKENITHWKDFWNSKYKNQLVLLNDMRDTFNIALLTLGYSINETNPKHIYEAYYKLKTLMTNIKIFNVDTIHNIYIDEDAVIGVIWDGDFNIIKKENNFLKYIYPKEGFSTWLESFVILKDAPNIDNAYTFINFMLRPEIAKIVSIYTGYSNANIKAIYSKSLQSVIHKRQFKKINMSLISTGQFQKDLSPEARRLYEKYWTLLRIGQ